MGSDRHIYTCGSSQKWPVFRQYWLCFFFLRVSFCSTRVFTCHTCRSSQELVSGIQVRLYTWESVCKKVQMEITEGIRKTWLCLLLFLPSCSAAQTLLSSAWERQMRSKNDKGATQIPMSSSRFSLLSQLFVTPAFLYFFPLLRLSLCWVHGALRSSAPCCVSLTVCLFALAHGCFFLTLRYSLSCLSLPVWSSVYLRWWVHGKKSGCRQKSSFLHHHHPLKKAASSSSSLPLLLFASVLTHLCSFVGLTQRGSTVLMYFYIFFSSKATKKGRLGSGGACLPHVEACRTRTDDARSVSVPQNLCLEANFKVLFHKTVLLNSLSGKTPIPPFIHPPLHPSIIYCFFTCSVLSLILFINFSNQLYQKQRVLYV